MQLGAYLSSQQKQ